MHAGHLPATMVAVSPLRQRPSADAAPSGVVGIIEGPAMPSRPIAPAAASISVTHGPIAGICMRHIAAGVVISMYHCSG